MTDNLSELLPEGWFVSEVQKAASLHNELQRELPDGHLLYHVEVKVIAHREGTDDILCQHKDNENHYTVVHLTWSMKQETNKEFPYIECDGNFDDFLRYEAKFYNR
ncbi:hypothetical protein D0T84_18270 [Dysgonomonas sp. 521]|uniref:hypothetical protein n=1 Tax=Dysgonomonas sp. 521 TaxID=2302932 RepID=UPI0013D4CB05|nr:hypothetical protein [Dysgonomonas sp. 521]NDV96838.1 hypothetical protein [Dysgonomonas sp. 521]